MLEYFYCLRISENCNQKLIKYVLFSSCPQTETTRIQYNLYHIHFSYLVLYILMTNGIAAGSTRPTLRIGCRKYRRILANYKLLQVTSKALLYSYKAVSCHLHVLEGLQYPL
jgi:hypothetical protein